MITFKKIAFFLPGLLLAACGSLEETPAGRADWPVEKMYDYAHAALNNASFEKSIQLYRELESRFPYGEYAEQAQIDLAYAYYRADEPEMAVSTVDRFLREHPTHKNADYAWYLKGLASFVEESGFIARITGMDDLHDRDPGAAQNAYDAFSELSDRYPDSRYAADARQRMVYLNEVLASHDIEIARHYLQRGAYIAVVNRAKYILEHHQGSPSIEHALGLLLQAYRKMGLRDLANDTSRVLQLNYPGSPYLSSG